MNNRLSELRTRFDRSDQEIKRDIGRYLHQRPARWISKQELVDEFDIDESGIGRHIQALHDEGYLLTTKKNQQLHAQWNGRGAGGLEYWVRQVTPSQLWSAGSELRPLLTLDSLGGAFVPTAAFGIFLLSGLIGGVAVVVISYAPGDALFGVSARGATLLTGALTVTAATFLILTPVAVLLERGLGKLIKPFRGPKDTEHE
jgi:biotin operon repressor